MSSAGGAGHGQAAGGPTDRGIAPDRSRGRIEPPTPTWEPTPARNLTAGRGSQVHRDGWRPGVTDESWLVSLMQQRLCETLEPSLGVSPTEVAVYGFRSVLHLRLPWSASLRNWAGNTPCSPIRRLTDGEISTTGCPCWPRGNRPICSHRLIDAAVCSGKSKGEAGLVRCTQPKGQFCLGENACLPKRDELASSLPGLYEYLIFERPASCERRRQV